MKGIFPTRTCPLGPPILSLTFYLVEFLFFCVQAKTVTESILVHKHLYQNPRKIQSSIHKQVRAVPSPLSHLSDSLAQVKSTYWPPFIFLVVPSSILRIHSYLFHRLLLGASRMSALSTVGTEMTHHLFLRSSHHMEDSDGSVSNN